jgi:hypothetical protein
MSEHELKCWPQFFEAIIAGEKTCELRRNDRNYQVGDVLRLREWDPFREHYTGRHYKVRVTHIISAEQACALSPEALAPGFCIMSVSP